MDAQQTIRIIQETNIWELISIVVGITVGVSGLIFSIVKFMKRRGKS